MSGAIEEGEPLGSVTVTVDGRRADRVALVAAESVEAATTSDKVLSFVKNPYVLIPLGLIVLAAGMMLARAGRRRKRDGPRPGPRSGGPAGGNGAGPDPQPKQPRQRKRRREKASSERTPEERRKMHEERMRRRQQRAGRGEGGRGMILTVTLNAAIDRTVAVPSFRQGNRHRAVDATTVAGGKGVNVARALKLLDRPVIATGLAGGPTGARLMENLAEEQILTDFTWIAGESRTNLAVVDPTTGEQTEINERGPDVSSEELDRFLEKLLYLARGARLCVIAGSLPPSVPASFAARMISELKELGTETLLDTEGEPLVASLRAGVGVVTPNASEAEGAVDHEFNDRDDLLAGLRSLIELGAGEAAITSERGCVASLVERGVESSFEVTAPELEPVATVGSGDAFLAGFAAARFDGSPAQECLRFAVACGAESTQHFGAGTIDPAEVERVASRVEVERLDTAAAVR